MTTLHDELTAERHYWFTPSEMLEALNAEFHFDFDPCPATATWSTYQTLTPGQVQLPGGVVTIAVVVDGSTPNVFDILWIGFTK